MIFKLSKDYLGFPNPHDGEEDGLCAIGGDLSFERLVLAYNLGYFPWYAYRKEDTPDFLLDEDGEPMIQWWCPLDRFVIFPNEIHISHSMRQMIRQGKYMVTFNKAFGDVINNCGALRDSQPGAWLGDKIKEAYTMLHDKQIAMSVEVWENVGTADEPQCGRLVGGLYGECIGKCFIGESMFSLVPSASKLALIALAKIMQEKGCHMIDCQLETAHLRSMGGRHISYEEYMEILSRK